MDMTAMVEDTADSGAMTGEHRGRETDPSPEEGADTSRSAEIWTPRKWDMISDVDSSAMSSLDNCNPSITMQCQCGLH